MKVNIPTSQGGLNLKDSLDAMDSRYAIQMDNVIPDTNKDLVVSGCIKVGTDGAVQLIPFNKTGYERLLTATDSAIYKLNSDKTRTLIKQGFTSGEWTYTDFTDGSGNTNTILANGTSTYPQRAFIAPSNVYSITALSNGIAGNSIALETDDNHIYPSGATLIGGTTSTKALGYLYFTLNPTDGKTLKIGAVTYRFKSTMAQINDIQIGATLADTIDHLTKTLNGGGVAGTDYYTGTTSPSTEISIAAETNIFLIVDTYKYEKLTNPISFKNRAYFIEQDTLKIKYSGVNAISGDLTDFDLSSIFALGGKLIAHANWTQDAGNGMENLYAAFTTNGEVAVYGGLSPAADDWALRGVFRISKPIGKNCLCKLGADLIVITEGGYFPLASVIGQDRANITPISDKINPIVIGKPTTSRWSIHWYSKKAWVIVNAPSTDTGYSYEQHILNYKTGGWFRRVGWDALTFVELSSNLYFCNSAGVYQADYGSTDDGKPITYYVQKAYTNGDSTNIKQVLLVKERTNTDGDIKIGTRIGIDFLLQDSSTKLVQVAGTKSLWDVALWDEAYWSDTGKITSTKTSLFSKYGTFISIGVLGQTSTPLEFNSFEAEVRIGNGTIW